MDFDPYLQWLQIPADRRPPTHYELLGLPNFESEERARKEGMTRIAHVRRYQLGDYSATAIRLLSELSAAFDTLTTPDRKQAYDAELRLRLNAPVAPSETQAIDNLSDSVSSIQEIAIRTNEGLQKHRFAGLLAVPTRRWLLATAAVAASAVLAYILFHTAHQDAVVASAESAGNPLPTTEALPSRQAPLDKTSPPAAPAKKVWQKLFTSEPELAGRRGAKLEGGVLQLNNTSLDDHAVKVGDCIVRARVKKVSGQNLSLRLRVQAGGHYGAWFNGGNWFGVGKSTPRGWQDLGQVRTAKSYNDWFEFKFATVGNELTVWAEGERILRVRDSAYLSGSPGLGALRGRSLFQNVEVQTGE